jgi:hypothetical protein
MFFNHLSAEFTLKNIKQTSLDIYMQNIDSFYLKKKKNKNDKISNKIIKKLNCKKSATNAAID